MNAVEIAEAVTALAERPFDASEFPYAFLEAFGNKEATIKRLRAGATNKSDVGGVLQTNNIHIAVCPVGDTSKKLAELRNSPFTTKSKAKFILATDGDFLEAEDINTGESIACPYHDFPNHFGFFLALAGITTIQQIRESSFDIRATGRLNKLYIELLKDNPEWGTSDRRHEMNHFMARLIFCFFAEDTGIFQGKSLFTGTVEKMSAKDSENTHEVIGRIFQAMNTRTADREAAQLPLWTKDFPYVNGGLFSGSTESPRFSRIARSYLLHIGSLDWKQINPDIFGSMIQAVADDEERGALGMHYTSVPNILKVLNPLFLDDLREKLEEAGDNPRSLLNLRKRLSRIRILDPACGSGNFLVIAYKEMRAIEAEINKRRQEIVDKPTEIRLTNFRGIELRDFPAEIARLALIIAEYQCDVRYRGERLALAEFLPLDGENWITCDNALRREWLDICPPTRPGVKPRGDDLFSSTLNQAEIEFHNEGGDTYICGNPPFKGARKQTALQKEDMEHVFGGGHAFKDCDYVTAWFLKAAAYLSSCDGSFAFVATNSISRGEQVPHLWEKLYEKNISIFFAHKQFQWRNNASDNAGVWCVVIGASNLPKKEKLLYDDDVLQYVGSISPYLISGEESFIQKHGSPLSCFLPGLVSGNMARDGGHLIMSNTERDRLVAENSSASQFLRPLIGTTEIKRGTRRWAVWVSDSEIDEAKTISEIGRRIEAVKLFRETSKAKTTRGYAAVAHRFAQRCHQDTRSIVLPKNTVEGVPYITPDLVDSYTVTTDLAFVAYTDELWLLALLSSTIHRVWAEAISGGLGSGIRYSSEITYNAFPVPSLTDKNRADLTRCAEDILLAREAHFPATIADLYNPDNIPSDLQEVHARNDEVLERIYIGRRFKNDTERLEKLFDLYTKMKGTTITVKQRKARKK